jgi:hypothetical protein
MDGNPGLSMIRLLFIGKTPQLSCRTSSVFRVKKRGFWPPRSPDLTSHELLLLGFLKERVYSNNSVSLEDLKPNH